MSIIGPVVAGITEVETVSSDEIMQLLHRSEQIYYKTNFTVYLRSNYKNHSTEIIYESFYVELNITFREQN